MRTRTQQELIDIIRFEIRGIPLPDGFTVSDEDSLIKLAKEHDLSHLVFDALEKNNIKCDSKSAMQQYYASIWRAEQMTHELDSMTKLFEANEIDFIPLKGSVIRPLYPEPWMRTSADIDILFRDEDADNVSDLLIRALGYVKDEGETSFHHLSFRVPSSGVHVEIHRMLFSDFQIGQNVLNQIPLVWEHVSPRTGYNHYLQMSDSFFYFYHIAHMIKHISSNGGCPIRSLIDLWILNNLPDRNEVQRKEILERANILTFAKMMSAMAKAWLEGGETPSNELEQFILTGQMYGNLKDVISFSVDENGLSKYVIKRVFLPYDTIKYAFPVLQRHRWLTPFFQVVRWTKVLKKEYRKKLVCRIRSLLQIDHEEVDQIDQVKQILGLKNTKDN